MKYTSAQANKLLRQLQDDRRAVLSNEDQRKSFVAATIEDIEGARPEYDYDATRERVNEIEKKIRKIKHAVNVFNSTHKVEGFDMTVDEMLVYIPQLTEKKMRLSSMAASLSKTRLSTSARSNIIEYEYAHYDIEKAQKDFEEVCRQLTDAQLALDRLNTTQIMEIEL